MPTKHVNLKQVNGLTFAAKANTNHWVVMDSSFEAGGNGAGSTPKELLLMSLAGCTSADVVSILKKKRIALENYEVNITAEECQEHPKVLTDIHIEYVFYGKDIQQKDVERAIELSSTKYCSVSAMIAKAANLTHSYRIVNSEVEEAV